MTMNMTIELALMEIIFDDLQQNSGTKNEILLVLYSKKMIQ